MSGIRVDGYPSDGDRLGSGCAVCYKDPYPSRMSVDFERGNVRERIVLCFPHAIELSEKLLNHPAIWSELKRKDLVK